MEGATGPRRHSSTRAGPGCSSWYRGCVSSDLDLLDAWRAGDRRAGSELFSRHFDSVYRFFRNKVDVQFEDLVQRTFVACLESRDRFREVASFRTFLFSIAHNLLREHFRRGSRAEVDFSDTSIVDLGAGPASVMAAGEQARLLVHALRKIPFESQVLLELYYWEELTGPELAAFLGVPEGAARTRLWRARKQLRAALADAEQGSSLTGSISSVEQWARVLRWQLLPAS